MSRSFEPDDFLCETCGYLLNGLGATDHCPECGTPVARSHPDRRTGSAWQRGARTPAAIAAVLRHPGRTFDQARPEVEGVRDFKHECIAASGFITAFVLLGVWSVGTLLSPGAAWHSDMFTVVLITNAAMFVMPLVVLLGLLTAIEKHGIRTFGRLHRRRIDDRVAETIVAHAAAAWITLPALVAAGWLLGTALGALARARTWALWELTLTAPVWAPVLGAFLALLWFELVVWTGVRRMRFANPPEAAHRVR
jgi:hypothetical protein